MKEFIPQKLPLNIELNANIYSLIIKASRKLAELNGLSKSIPNPNILINALILQEAKDSSEIENIITTHDELFLSQIDESKLTRAAKEVKDYENALKKGYELLKKERLLRNAHILEIQKRLERNNAGFRKQSGTMLKNPITGEIKHIPPQNDIQELMRNLEQYINDDTLDELDFLVKMAIIHYQFESIHPFYDGNGRTGRIINILYLVYKGLLDLPILYLSAYIVKNKGEYYSLLQKVRDEGAILEWIEYILKGVEQTAIKTIETIATIEKMMLNVSEILQNKTNFYSKDFVELLFSHPYTKIDFLIEKLNISRQSASKYLKICENLGVLECIKIGRNHYYINIELLRLFKKGIF
ncbi:Fic family protein [Campylobacter jejuni]|uniref:Fic family protein n=1 Tax=Campylobacter jejuni TaxID=197 RepID=UPI00127CAB15|nr:Fic family protein [Campylobacter jejuni]EAL8076158.1 Fic family protein [Campylobacter jejuni]EAL8096477.1 Fic family protein [Campylobacter jejuni]EDB2054967.1 Fic family protein [Campylobacter jejuni]EDJ6118049.1 Fic family protein [Campylobacter jejuni]EDP7260970.1 Fic family protein [Campylobacter jejuni]